MMTPEKAQSVVRIQGLMNYTGVSFLRGMDSVSESLTSGKTFNISSKISQETADNLKSIVAIENKIDASEERVSVIRERQEKAVRKASPVQTGFRFIENGVKRVLAKPFRALKLLLAGLFITNIPPLIEQIKMFARRVKLFVTQLNQVGELVVTTLRNSIDVVKALLENIKNFDFNDSEKRVQAAIRQFDEDMAEQKEDLAALDRAWDLDEQELEKFIQNLDDGLDPSEAFTNIFPTETVTGDPASTNPETSSAPGGTPGYITDDLFDLIASGEGDYNSINRGNAGDTPGGAKSVFGKDLTEMSVGEVMSLQAQGKLYAVGKYQIIPSTMIDFVRKMGIKSADKFDAETQEKFKAYVLDIKRPEVGRYIRGESDDRTAAAQGLAREFASVGAARPETIGGYQPAQRGDTLFGGQGDNAASVSPASVESALDTARSTYSTTGSMATPAPATTPEATPSTPTAGSEVIHTPTSQGTLIDGVDWNRVRDVNGAGSVGVTRSIGGSHRGVDIGTSKETGWLFAFKKEAYVTKVSYDDTSGNYIVIKAGGLEYAFMHLKGSPYWRKGDTIPVGMPIGEIGNTGRSRGEHLHFEVWRGDTFLDPMNYLHLLIIGKQRRRRSASKLVSFSNIEDFAANKLSTNLEALAYDYDDANKQNTVLIAQQPILATQTNTIVVPGGGGSGPKPVVVVNNKSSRIGDYNNSLMTALS